MNKYTKLSDAEVNTRIFISLYGEESLKDKDMLRYFSRVDYCNNPSDAMSIIIENGISMVRVNNTWSARQFNNHCIEINGDNYYRIAMEVYLLMNGK